MKDFTSDLGDKSKVLGIIICSVNRLTYMDSLCIQSYECK